METSCKNLFQENQTVNKESLMLDVDFSTSADPLFDILTFPDSIILHIFSYLPFTSVCAASRVCRRWNQVGGDDLLWRTVFLKYYKLPSSVKMPQRASSWRAEFKRLYYHTPAVLAEERKEHKDEVLHVSFSHNGKMFATCSKDGFFKVWEVKHPCRLLFEMDMMSSFSWKFTQFSQFNETDTCLLVSGVYFGRLSTSGEIAVFNLQDDFRMQCRVTNKPYDVFGAWYDNDHLLSGTLYWTGDFNSVSAVWLSKASQEVESEVESVSMVLYRFENVNSSSIRLLHVAEVDKWDDSVEVQSTEKEDVDPASTHASSIALEDADLHNHSCSDSHSGLSERISEKCMLDQLLKRAYSENEFDIENEDKTDDEMNMGSRCASDEEFEDSHEFPCLDDHTSNEKAGERDISRPSDFTSCADDTEIDGLPASDFSSVTYKTSASSMNQEPAGGIQICRGSSSPQETSAMSVSDSNLTYASTAYEHSGANRDLEASSDWSGHDAGCGCCSKTDSPHPMENCEGRGVLGHLDTADTHRSYSLPFEGAASSCSESPNKDVDLGADRTASCMENSSTNNNMSSDNSFSCTDSADCLDGLPSGAAVHLHQSPWVKQIGHAATQTDEPPSRASSLHSLSHMSHSSSLSRELSARSPREKLLIYTWGSETYIPHKIGIKRMRWSDFSKGEITARRASMLLPDVMENLHNMAGARRDTPDITIEMHGHVVGMSLSPDHRHLYVNCRPWPKNYIISDPQESPPLAQEVEILTIDLTTFNFVGPVLRSHKAYTHSDECFFLNLDVARDFVVSGAEDKRGYLWDRHYGIPLYHFQHSSVVNCMAVNPMDPEMVVSVSDDHTFRVWRSRSSAKQLFGADYEGKVDSVV